MFKFRAKNKPAPEPGTADESPPQAPPEAADPAPKRAGLGKRLARSRRGFGDRLRSLFRLKRELDAELFEELETLLLSADVGAETTLAVIDALTGAVKRRELGDGEAVLAALKHQLIEILGPCEQPLQIDPANAPHVILVVGVNGVGKTTTIGKLAQRLEREGRSVLLAAGDTFRAAAIEQLQQWGERVRAPVIAQQPGADSASVVFDALQAARARGIDVLIADTAGRLHTQTGLMEELKKIKRVLGKLDPSAPHETLLVIDGGTGQNALAQTTEFHGAIGLDGIAITKLDGTAKGGIVFALARKHGLPIRLIGVGESAADLRDFEARPFVEALMADSGED